MAPKSKPILSSGIRQYDWIPARDQPSTVNPPWRCDRNGALSIRGDSTGIGQSFKWRRGPGGVYQRESPEVSDASTRWRHHGFEVGLGNHVSCVGHVDKARRAARGARDLGPPGPGSLV